MTAADLRPSLSEKKSHREWRENGMSTSQRSRAWKAKFGGVDGSDAKRFKVLEEETAELKPVSAEDLIDHTAPGGGGLAGKFEHPSSARQAPVA